MKDPIQQTLENKRLRLRQIEAEYLRTKEYLTSPEWQAKRDDVLMRLVQIFGLYRPGMQPLDLGIIFGQSRQIIWEVQAVTDIIVEHDSLETELKHYYERAG